jgi:hypothetical protein
VPHSWPAPPEPYGIILGDVSLSLLNPTSWMTNAFAMLPKVCEHRTLALTKLVPMPLWVLGRHHLESSPRHIQDWFLKCRQGGRAHSLDRGLLATLCSARSLTIWLRHACRTTTGRCVGTTCSSHHPSTSPPSPPTTPSSCRTRCALHTHPSRCVVGAATAHRRGGGLEMDAAHGVAGG